MGEAETPQLRAVSEAGYKLTGPRKRIWQAMRAAHEPLTAQEIAARAATSVASTYRVLALLVEIGVVGETPDPNALGEAEGRAADGHDPRGKRYALCSASGHHHHFVCRACHSALEVRSEALERAFAEMERESGHHIERHDVVLCGVCADCLAQGVIPAMATVTTMTEARA